MPADPEQRVDLVFEGGGVKGLAFVGALEVLEARGYVPQALAGTSAGAITAALLAAGYSAAELRDVMLDLDLGSFRDEDALDRIPLIGHVLSTLLDKGIYEGRRFERWMEGMLDAKGIRTFADLAASRAARGLDGAGFAPLRVIASDATARSMLVLPEAAADFGIVPDELSVARAVRMSMSIPIFFEPVVLPHPETGEDHLIVDGGMLSNFPVFLFDREDGPPQWPTFGMLLVEGQPRAPIADRLPRRTGVRERSSTLEYLRSLAETMMEARDRMFVESADFARTIAIPTLGVGTTEFDLPHERKLALIDSGRDAATAFLDSWDFAAYIERYRSGKPRPSRRAEVHARP